VKAPFLKLVAELVSRDDGVIIKKSIVEALKKHLTFSQILRSTVLVQKVGAEKAIQAFAVFNDEFDRTIEM